MSPPRARPHLATGGVRSPLAEVTEERRHSVNSNPPEHPLSRHGSPMASAARKKEGQKEVETEEEDGGGGGKVCNIFFSSFFFQGVDITAGIVALGTRLSRCIRKCFVDRTQ